MTVSKFSTVIIYRRFFMGRRSNTPGDKALLGHTPVCCRRTEPGMDFFLKTGTNPIKINDDDDVDNVRSRHVFADDK